MTDADARHIFAQLADECVQLIALPVPEHLRNTRDSMGDIVWDGAPEFSYHQGQMRSDLMLAAERCVAEHPEFAPILARDGGQPPYVISDDGGGQCEPWQIVSGIVSAAVRRLYFEGRPFTSEGMYTLMIESFESLKKAAQGEAVTIHDVHGFAGMALPEGAEILTPWGILRPAPAARYSASGGRTGLAQTTAVLMRPKQTRYTVSPTLDMPPAEPGYYTDQRRMEMLLPLAVTLATAGSDRCAPAATFATRIEPIRAGSGGALSSVRLRPTRAVKAEHLSSIEEWTARLQRDHVDVLNVAARRLLRANGERFDPEDELIDAVTVWEALVGAKGETVMRVTAALARLLVPAPENRRQFQKELTEIYKHRSSVVHGGAVDPAKVRRAAEDAVDVAVRALKEIYLRGGDWLNLESEVRSNRLILG